METVYTEVVLIFSVRLLGTGTEKFRFYSKRFAGQAKYFYVLRNNFKNHVTTSAYKSFIHVKKEDGWSPFFPVTLLKRNFIYPEILQQQEHALYFTG